MATTQPDPHMYTAVLFQGRHQIGHGPGTEFTVILDLQTPRGLTRARYELNLLLALMATELAADTDPAALHLSVTGPHGHRFTWRLLEPSP
ncbi:hypothetical protein F4553_005378 [Allocatelliglobosispora scoriae]|uniref:Uncharacterized protein n=1 Tax=Allocatelliglobosispora scoriae TaxID=643052 RepID=A0A841BXZ1_9ACTN|nr:hypothetical protein [Allocatelliglobosispora scoriae]MBB5871999.1 hypothetical protein [Allocatelliglobosispora scoriae]